MSGSTEKSLEKSEAVQIVYDVTVQEKRVGNQLLMVPKNSVVKIYHKKESNLKVEHCEIVPGMGNPPGLNAYVMKREDKRKIMQQEKGTGKVSTLMSRPVVCTPNSCKSSPKKNMLNTNKNKQDADALGATKESDLRGSVAYAPGFNPGKDMTQEKKNDVDEIPLSYIIRAVDSLGPEERKCEELVQQKAKEDYEKANRKPMVLVMPSEKRHKAMHTPNAKNDIGEAETVQYQDICSSLIYEYEKEGKEADISNNEFLQALGERIAKEVDKKNGEDGKSKKDGEGMKMKNHTNQDEQGSKKKNTEDNKEKKQQDSEGKKTQGENKDKEA